MGGTETNKNQYPFVAAIRYLKPPSKNPVLQKPFCGATIITRRHAVTAAHCTKPVKPEKIGLVVGVHNMAKSKYTSVLWLICCINFNSKVRISDFTFSYFFAKQSVFISNMFTFLMDNLRI